MTCKFIVFILCSLLLISGCISQQRKEEPYPSEDIESESEKGKGNEMQFPDTRWSYMDLPPLTNEQRFELALRAQEEGEAYYQRALKEAEELSRTLEEYIYQWLEGNVDADIPEGLLPPYIDSAKTHDWKLVSPDDITPEEQWYAMTMYDPTEELHQHSPDPHATYLKLIFIAPFGSKLLIEGDFPYCRFMDYQILQPFDPYHPVTGNMGVCEVPLVDVDIDPDPGHINPFRLGADRTAENRHYHLTFELQIGNAAALNNVMKEPHYRAPGNTRVGGPFGFAGPWGDSVLVPSIVWLRIYAPDTKKEPYGGVNWPKATLQLPTGEKYWITCDKSKAVADQTASPPNRLTRPEEPYPFQGPSLGWLKMFGIDLAILEGNAILNSELRGIKDALTAKKDVRNLYSLLWNRGPDADPPGNFECSATCCAYISYLLRPTTLGKDKVIVLTGKLPEFPRTRNGESIMTDGDVRYFSITHQQGSGGMGKSIYTSVPHGSLMDDEIIVNDKNEYILVYSRSGEKPGNARKENGVTWQEWGPSSQQGFVIRWLSVSPDWYLSQFVPDSNNIPWRTGAWSQDMYDKTLVGENQPGVMGPYHPVVHYMTREEFEALGDNLLTPEDIPEWINSETQHEYLISLVWFILSGAVCLFTGSIGYVRRGLTIIFL